MRARPIRRITSLSCQCFPAPASCQSQNLQFRRNSAPDQLSSRLGAVAGSFWRRQRVFARALRRAFSQLPGPDHLERHHAIELDVPRPIHHVHAAAADLLQQLIVAKPADFSPPELRAMLPTWTVFNGGARSSKLSTGDDDFLQHRFGAWGHPDHRLPATSLVHGDHRTGESDRRSSRSRFSSALANRLWDFYHDIGEIGVKFMRRGATVPEGSFMSRLLESTRQN